MRFPDAADAVRKLQAENAELKRRRERVPGHLLDHHEDVNLQGAKDGSALVRGPDAIWRPGAAGGGAHPLLILRASTRNGEAAVLLYEAPDDLYTFNLGGFFTESNGFISPAADCIVRVSAWADWGNPGGTWSPAGTRHMLEVTRLQTVSPVSDYRYQHTTPYMVTTRVDGAVGRLNADDPMWVTASHNAAGSQGLVAYVSVERLSVL